MTQSAAVVRLGFDELEVAPTGATSSESETAESLAAFAVTANDAASLLPVLVRLVRLTVDGWLRISDIRAFRFVRLRV